MAKFRERPVVIEAIQWTGKNLDEVMSELFFVPQHPITEDGRLIIFTPDGEIQARPGDWIIKSINGELDVYKADIFTAIYEVIPPPPPDYPYSQY